MEGQVTPPPPRAIVVHAADVGRIGIYGLSGRLTGQIAQCVLAPHGYICRRPLSREQDVRAGGPTPSAASLSARQEATEVEAPVYLRPARRSKERRKTGSCLK